MPLWNENAVAVERRQGETVIIGEGTLAALRTSALTGVRVSLPDRRVPPFIFEGQGLVELLRDPSRPDAQPTKLLAPVIE